MPFLERPSPAHLGRSLASGNSRYGLQVTGNDAFGQDDAGLSTRWFTSLALTGSQVTTISSTGTTTAQPFDEQLAVIGRFALAPFSGTNWQAHLGANFQYVLQPNDLGPAAPVRYGLQLRDRPELRVDGTRLIETGLIDSKGARLFGLEAGFTSGPFMVEGEWVRVTFDRRLTTGSTLPDPKFGGWYVQGVWVLTGENRPYNPVEARFDGLRPNNNFAPAAGVYGAFEVAARYSVTDLNDRSGRAGTLIAPGAVRGGEQKIGTLGLNWVLNPSMRVMLHYQHVNIDRLTAAGLQAGQSYDTLTARGQVSF